MASRSYNISDLISFCDKTDDVKDISFLQIFLKTHRNTKIDIRLFDFAREKDLWIRRAVSLENAGRDVFGLKNLADRLSVTKSKLILDSVWMNVSGFTAFVVVNPQLEQIFGYMVLKSPSDIDARRAAFKPDGSFDSY